MDKPLFFKCGAQRADAAVHHVRWCDDVGASLGVAELAEHHESPAQWLAQADAACYEAKRAGRGTVRMARNSLRVIGGAG